MLSEKRGVKALSYGAFEFCPAWGLGMAAMASASHGGGRGLGPSDGGGTAPTRPCFGYSALVAAAPHSETSRRPLT